MFGFGFLPAVLVIVFALWYIPESPQWMLTHNRVEQARELMSSVTNTERADRMVRLVTQRTEEEESKRDAARGTTPPARHGTRPCGGGGPRWSARKVSTPHVWTCWATAASC